MSAVGKPLAAAMSGARAMTSSEVPDRRREYGIRADGLPDGAVPAGSGDGGAEPSAGTPTGVARATGWPSPGTVATGAPGGSAPEGGVVVATAAGGGTAVGCEEAGSEAAAGGAVPEPIRRPGRYPGGCTSWGMVADGAGLAGTATTFCGGRAGVREPGHCRLPGRSLVMETGAWPLLPAAVAGLSAGTAAVVGAVAGAGVAWGLPGTADGVPRRRPIRSSTDRRSDWFWARLRMSRTLAPDGAVCPVCGLWARTGNEVVSRKAAEARIFVLVISPIP